jgi:hypothetical protein
MKVHKNLTLSREAIARGEKLAAERSSSLSQVIEEQLLAIPSPEAAREQYWSGPAFKPVARPGDPRHE